MALKKKIADDLLKRLMVAPHSARVPAVVQLKSAKHGALLPHQVTDLAQRILTRATAETAQKASRVQVFDALETFSFEGPAELIKAVAKQDEVLQVVDDSELEMLGGADL